jgi:hypothetical protein
MRACMHALCCAHSRSSLRCAHGCQELFPSPHTALWRHQHRSHRAVAARTARAHTARARAAGRGPSTHTPTTNRTSTPRTQHGHTGVRSAKRTGAGSAVPRPCLRSLAAVGLRHLPTCATWAPCVWRWPGAWPWRNAPRARPATNADTLPLEAAAHGHTSSTNGPSTRAQAAGARAGRFTAPGARTARHALQRQRLNSPRAHTHSASVPKYAPPAPRDAHSRHHHPHIRHGQRARPTRTWSSMRGSGAALAQHRGRLWNVVG